MKRHHLVIIFLLITIFPAVNFMQEKINNPMFNDFLKEIYNANDSRLKKELSESFY